MPAPSGRLTAVAVDPTGVQVMIAGGNNAPRHGRGPGSALGRTARAPRGPRWGAAAVRRLLGRRATARDWRVGWDPERLEPRDGHAPRGARRAHGADHRRHLQREREPGAHRERRHDRQALGSRRQPPRRRSARSPRLGVDGGVRPERARRSSPPARTGRPASGTRPRGARARSSAQASRRRARHSRPDGKSVLTAAVGVAEALGCRDWLPRGSGSRDDRRQRRRPEPRWRPDPHRGSGRFRAHLERPRATSYETPSREPAAELSEFRPGREDGVDDRG